MCISSKAADVRNDEPWHFATTYDTILPWRASTNSSNEASPGKSWRLIPRRQNGMQWPRPISSNGSSPSRSRGDIQQTCQINELPTRKWSRRA